MDIEIENKRAEFDKADLKIVALYSKEGELVQNWEDKDLFKQFSALKVAKNFKAKAGETAQFSDSHGNSVLVIGMGDKKAADTEALRRATANTYKKFVGEKYETVAFDATSFNCLGDLTKSLAAMTEGLELASYTFDKYKSSKSKNSFEEVLFYTSKKAGKKMMEELEQVSNVVESINFARDLINEAPNVLTSVAYADLIEKDVRNNLKGKGVKVKILGKADLKKEKMGLFLAVNAGSAFEPRLVHLTYTPKKATSETKHVALVGKGLTFDTGGYSLKPGASMMGMKFDMGGSATVYGAFRAAVLNEVPCKVTCILGMTDNAVSSNATFPDAIVRGRNGTSVEILNTDAEGRLVLADCLDYACDQKPDQIIDAATLTGACLVALGNQVCAVLGNDDKFVNKLMKSAKTESEYLWQLPIIPEWRDDMKSKIADLKNIGTPMRAGTATAAAFLEHFIRDGISWAHLDIAGVCTDASHLPYCPPKGASGSMIRTLYHYLNNAE